MYKIELHPRVPLSAFTDEKNCRLIYVKRGCLNVFSGNTHYVLHSGDGLLIFPYIEYSFKTEAFEGFSVCFENRFFPENILSCFYIKTGPRSSFRTLCSSLYTRLCKVGLRDRVYPAEAIINTALNIFIHTTEAYSKRYTLRCNRPALIAKAYIDKNYTKNISVYDVADNSGLSVSKLATEFSAEFSVTPKQYILGKRLEKACELLGTTALSASEISIAVGFSTPSGFNRFFRKKLGITPLEYRSKTKV